MKYNNPLQLSNQTKICISCNIEKPLERFSFRSGEKRHNKCKECQVAYGKQHYQNHKAIYIARAKKNEIISINRNQDFIRSYKEGKPCTDCNVQYPYYVMDFDHLEGTQKLQNVSYLTRQAFSLERIKEEMDKCELVCSNCHRIRTHKRRIARVAEQE